MSAPTNVSTQHPHLYRLAIDMASRAEAAGLRAGLATGLLELLKIRVSQLNGCAFCLRQHTHDALAAGESTDRLAVLPAWRETAYFTDAERAALTLAERVTDIGSDASHHISEDTVSPLTDEQVSAVAWLAIALNTFNRIAITSHYEVAPPALQAAAG